ncbi:hypothetical protein HED60_06865 [Planctomycetales bacterium ZRK34]|nr:hypothetical protein HED60_06865 [Planctomycetales bacterium ZRK34]
MSDLQLKRPSGDASKSSGKWIMLGVLGLLLVGVTVKQFSGKSRGNRPHPSAQAPSASANPTQSSASTQVAVVPITWSTQRPRDPFALEVKAAVVDHSESIQTVADKPSAASAADTIRKNAQRELSLTSTIIGAQPVAIINGQLCSPGADVAGYTLVKVQQRSVIVAREGVTVTIDLVNPLSNQGPKSTR